VVLVLIVSLVAFSVFVNGTERGEFEEWMKKYNKEYQTQEEFEKRLNIFKDNLVRYSVLNSKDDTVLHGPTQFSDLTQPEFVQKYLNPNIGDSINKAKSQESLESVGIAGAFPSNFSWVEKGDVTPVQNEGDCGDPYIFSVVENIESLAAIKSGKLVALSIQQVLDCEPDSYGCNGGYPDKVYEYIIQTGGLESAKSYPYRGVPGTCRFQQSLVVASISSWFYVTTKNNETEIQEYVYTKGPPSACVDAETWSSYNGGVFTSKNCQTELDTCVQIVGWTVFEKIPAWIVRTNWGSSYGYSGYVYVAMGENACGIAQMVQSAVISKVDSSS